MWGVQVQGNPRYLLRAICTREEGVQTHRLSRGDAQHRSWESRQQDGGKVSGRRQGTSLRCPCPGTFCGDPYFPPATLLSDSGALRIEP